MASICLADAYYSQNGQQKMNRSKIVIEEAVKTRWNFWCGSWQVVKTSITIINNQQEVIYIKDDKTIRQEKILDITNNFELMQNVEQIRYLTWNGQFSDGKKKVGLWNAYWKLKKINVGGYYDLKSKKQGKWVEIFENYWDFAQVTYRGLYKSGQKCGLWEILYENRIIGVGIYDEQGYKNGEWIDLHNNFYDECQVRFFGNYKNGVKQGSWVTKHNRYYEKEHHNIGGGLYNEEGRKTGIWIEISESFNENSQITYIGAYSNGKKQKRWITKFYDIEIGGGNYDNAGQKINLWIELHENFGGGCEVIYQGSYKFGNKCGIWDIQHRQYADNQFQVIGYQMFNEFGLKNGINMELSQIFLNDYQIIYVGSYKNGLKFGQWEIKYRESNVEEFIEIGGGQYNDEGLKIGIWADIDDEFNNFNKYINIGQYILGEKTGQFIVKQLE